MPKAVTKYQTFDGKSFDNESDAEQHEREINMAEAVKSIFPNNEHLSNGDFYRLPSHMIVSARHKLADYMDGQFNDNAVIDFRNNTGDMIGRFLDDSGSPLYSAWMLFACIDDDNRMFNQPYFVNNPPSEGEEVLY